MLRYKSCLYCNIISSNCALFSIAVDSDEEKCGGKANMEYKASFKSQCQNTCADRDRSVDCDDLRSVISMLLDWTN